MKFKMTLTFDEAIKLICYRIKHKFYGCKEGACHAQPRKWLKESKDIKEPQEGTTPEPFHNLKCKAIALTDDRSRDHIYLDAPCYLSSVTIKDTNFFKIRAKMSSDSEKFAGQWKEIYFPVNSIKGFSYIPYEQEDK